MKQRERSDRPTSTNTIGQCMFMNHDDGECQTATESESTMWRWTQCLRRVYDTRQRKCQSGKRWHAEDTLLHHKVSSQSFSRDVIQRIQVICADCAHERVEVIPVFGPRVRRLLRRCHKLPDTIGQKIDLHRSNDGRDCEGLRAKALSLLNANVETKITYSSEFWADGSLRRFVECDKRLDLTCEI
jgi:hypothetical protein